MKKKEVIKLYKSGMKIKDIMNSENISATRIYQILKENKIKKNRPVGNSKRDLYVKVNKEYKANKGKLLEICMKYGLHPRTYYNWKGKGL